jgi:A/G-specific adenine glycosylase
VVTRSLLARWYDDHGRHTLPWRQTQEQWAVLVSEIMLQQTSVARVLEPWQRFMNRWPTPAAMAATPLDDVLREWKGLGYPRRARALWQCAHRVSRDGWPATESALRELPGIGPYTARALLHFAFASPSPPPRDVNLARVAARAWLHCEADDASPTELDAAIQRHKPRDMNDRSYIYALFDIGATLCTARAVDCSGCPLRRTCASKHHLIHGDPIRQRRQAQYHGSMRELRGAILNTALQGHVTACSLHKRLQHLPQARELTVVEQTLATLRNEGLLTHA